MAEMTLKVQVDLPPEFAVAGPYAELVQAGLSFLGRVQWDGDRWVFEGSAKDWETFGNLCAAGVRRCREMEDALPLAAAPQSSGDRILALTKEVADLTEMMVAHHNARRTAEKALEEITRIAETSLAAIDAQLDAMSTSITSRRDAS